LHQLTGVSTLQKLGEKVDGDLAAKPPEALEFYVNLTDQTTGKLM
jgi:hypothetical protein